MLEGERDKEIQKTSATLSGCVEFLCRGRDDTYQTFSITRYNGIHKFFFDKFQ